ncbi:MAG TPA: hypothetical protein ENI08_01445, partial [Candidatus Dependentiae bacterium]|nr:hypothetical protein [Candidatus Dependentiae bacterium]
MRKRPTIVNSFFIMFVTFSLVNTIYTSVDATTVESEDCKSVFREMASTLYQQDTLTAEDEEKYVMEGNDFGLALRYLIYFNAQF